MIKLGDKYKDKITGYTGIATARVIFLTGCVRVELTSTKLSKEGKPQSEYFDEMNLVTLGGRKPKNVSEKPAGPNKNPTRKSVASRF